MGSGNIRSQLREVGEKLRDPFRLRLCVAGLAVVLGYLAIYSPIDSRMTSLQRQLREEERRRKLAEEVDLLQAQFQGFESRLQPGSDVNEWIQYVLQGVRRKPLKLVNLDVNEERKLGPYRALVMRLHVTGEMQHLDALLQWLEENERLFRVDSLILEPARGQVQHRSMQMTLLALKA